MKSSFPIKFKSLREKNGGHRHKKSAEGSGHKARPISAEAFFSMFRSDPAKTLTSEEKEQAEKDAAKVEDILGRLEELNLHHVDRDNIRFALKSLYAAGDVDKAVDLMRVQQQASSGIVAKYNPNVEMVGAENRNMVTCYLDALLFAMFAKLDAFDCMLRNDLPKPPQRHLATLLRLWVNMLRSGKLIHIDMTEMIQNALAECGWKEARNVEQQDTSEAFAEITEMLELPLLTLQVDLFHQGKGDIDDHKVVYERLLNLAVPPDPEGKGIRLEDCLEEYFNTRVDVLRDTTEDKAVLEKMGAAATTIRVVTKEEGSGDLDEGISLAPVQRRHTDAEPPSSSRPLPRHRATSIIQRIVVDEQGKPERPQEPVVADSPTMLQKVMRQGSTVVKAVTIPAWQFFRLIPWHSTTNPEPQSNLEVMRQFNKRPVVGICLKRYMMTEQGQPIRQNTFIDIPDSLRLPRFMMAEELKASDDDAMELNADYKLVLQSVVCHRGESLHSGHYVAFARTNPKLLTDNRRHDSDPPPDYEEAQWVMFDDLADTRVTHVEDIRKSLKEEMPYLLFYQIVPMVDVIAASSGETDIEPPSYSDSAIQVSGALTPNPDAERANLSRHTSDYFDTRTWNSSTAPPSVKVSLDLDRPRVSFDEEAHLPKQHGSPQRESSAAADGSGYSQGPTPEGPSPAVTPADETTAQRLSRAAAQFTKRANRSRPPSQAGEGRRSLNISRFGLMRTSKEPLRASEDAPEQQADATEGTTIQEHQSHAHHKKERGKSKTRLDKDGKEKEKSKSKGGEPERECVVM